MQPKNKPENLTPPNRGPAYKPVNNITVIVKEESMSETKVVWHPYPYEIPQKNGLYLITCTLRDSNSVGFDFYINGQFFDNEGVVAWAELPDPYKEI